MPRIAAAHREAHQAARRDHIVAAAVKLWTEQGFDATTVEAVAAEAGLAKGTVYLYFPSKEAIFAAAVERYTLLPELAELSETLGAAPLVEAISHLTARLWRRLREAAPQIGVLFRELALRPAEARHFLEGVVLPANRLFASWLEARMQAGEARPIDPFVAARALVGMLVMFAWTQEVLGGKALRPVSDDAIVRTVSSLFLHGVAAPPRLRRSSRPRR